MKRDIVKRWIICSFALVVTIGYLTQGQTLAALDRAADKSGKLTQAAAVDLYSRYRKALIDGDYNAFLESVYAPGKPAGLARVPQEQIPKEFTNMKSFILELSPDLAAAKILQFAANDKAAVLVTRVDLDNGDYVTLRALMFATDKGSWKVLTKIYDDTFPRKASEADEKVIQNKLKDNPNLQLAAAVAQAEAIAAAGSKPATPAAELSGTVQAEGKLKTDTTGRRRPETGAVSGTVEEAPTLSNAFNDSPEHEAIVKKLREEGKNQMLLTASSVAMAQDKDFANVNIIYSRQGKPAAAALYLFKEDDTWVAYLELPTWKDHSAIFSTLARRYCLPRYKYLESTSLIDDTWQSKNPQKRIVNLVCSELINNQWQDHRLTLVYEYGDEKGWHITGQVKTKQPSPRADKKKGVSASPPESAKPKIKPKAIWGNAKAAIDEILLFIGSNPKPVFILFGSDQQDFITFHYVTEKEGKDIQAVDWLNGKLRGPQVSRLVRPCPPVPLEEVNFDHVSRIFDEMSRKAKRGDRLNVNLSRRSSNGCQEPIWQGIATSSKHALTVTYSMDGKQTDIEEYSF